MKLFRLLLFVFMLSVCSVVGVAPVIPKRKEQYSTEIKVEIKDKKEDTTDSIRPGDFIQ